jgi:hypothetical protein
LHFSFLTTDTLTTNVLFNFPRKARFTMWIYPKSAVHQAAIDVAALHRDREAARDLKAAKKLARQNDGQNALKEREATKVAIVAKTARLRAARLAREAAALPAKVRTVRQKR